MNGTRIDRRFADMARQQRAGLAAFVTAGDPDPDLSARLVAGLPGAGADIIEIGMPFTDPMADGPVIQASSQRALKAGMTLAGTIDLVRQVRRHDDDTPIILMGYYNPIYSYGNDAFLKDAVEAGVDGLILVDLPSEEDRELCLPALEAGLNWIRLATPTTDSKRLPDVLAHASGFVYYVSITGITGTRAATSQTIASAVDRLRRHTDLPVAVGFGIRNGEQAAGVARIADAVVVGSAFCQAVADGLDNGKGTDASIDNALTLCESISHDVRKARA